MTKIQDLEYEIRAVPHYWRNRISFSTSQILEKADMWNWIVHKRIARYFRLYTQILNFSVYMLVSHRNMVSIYDMSSHSDQWIQTLSFDEGMVRTMLIKKRPRRSRVKLRLDELQKFDIHSLEDDKGQVVLTNF